VFSTYLSDAALNHIFRNTPLTSPATVYAALLTAITDEEAGTVTEASYAGYARVAITFGAPGAGQGGRQISNSAKVTFGKKTDAGSQTFIGIGIYDAAAAGNLLGVIPLDGADQMFFVADDTAGDTLRCAAHGMVADQRARFEPMPGGALPTGLSSDTTYWVIAGGLTADAFKVSTTQGGAAVDITAVGRGVVKRLTPVTANQNDTPEFDIGTLKVALD
jgi:hypothetical protein